jgi:hypothetical protein
MRKHYGVVHAVQKLQNLQAPAGMDKQGRLSKTNVLTLARAPPKTEKRNSRD